MKNMKKMMFVLCAILVAFSLVSCKQVGKTNNVVMNIGKSDKFSVEEINVALNCVKKSLKNYEGCNLTKLWYDDEKSNNSVKGYLKNGRGSVNGAKTENVIVFLSNFDVGPSDVGGTLNLNSTYSDWMWILIRDSKTGNWKVDDIGY